jgi:uncharacterized membrane protein YjgN (DUF898 family)
MSFGDLASSLEKSVSDSKNFAPLNAAQGREDNPELNLMTLAPAPGTNETVERFRFTGATRDYFRIWIVNLFLTLITLGLWSPWAKIRKRKWFLRNTWVAGANFEFHARPWPILRGRLLAAGAFFLYWIAGEFKPEYALWIALALSLIAPWLIINSMRFNLANTSYRNIRFRFDGVLKDGFIALWPFILYSGLSIVFPPKFETDNEREVLRALLIPTLILLLLYPYVHGASRLLVLNNSRLGSAVTRCTTRIKTFYTLHLRGGAVGLGLIVLGAIGIFSLGFAAFWVGDALAGAKLPAEVQRIAAVLAGIVLVSPMIVATYFWYGFTQSRVINSTFNLTTVGDNVRVFSEIKTTPLAKLYILNTLAIVFSLGLLIPWAAVRTARLRVETTALAITGDLNQVVAAAVPAVSAAADAGSDFFSMDVAL